MVERAVYTVDESKPEKPKTTDERVGTLERRVDALGHIVKRLDQAVAEKLKK